jgi:hypothetical protein
VGLDELLLDAPIVGAAIIGALRVRAELRRIRPDEGGAGMIAITWTSVLLIGFGVIVGAFLLLAGAVVYFAKMMSDRN